MTTNADRHRLTRRIAKVMREFHPELSQQLLDSLSMLAANAAADLSDEQAQCADSSARGPRSAEDPPPPAVVLEIEQALLNHFPEMPQYAARALSGNVFEELQDFHQWKVHPFPDQHLLPPTMRRGPAPPWPDDPESSHGLRFRLVRIDE